MKLFLLSLFAMLTCRCGYEQQIYTRVAANHYFGHGDPLALLEGTKGNPESFFTRDSLDQFNGFHLSGLQAFYQVSLKTRLSAELMDIEKRSQKLPQQLDQLFNYRFTANGSELTYDSEDPHLPVLGFSNQGGRVRLHSFNSHPAKVLHYSLGQERDVFSLLLLIQDQVKGTYLSALYFTKSFSISSEPNERLTLLDFSYLLGRRRAIGWKDDLEVSICGGPALNFDKEFLEGINSWQSESGKIAGLTVNVIMQPDPMPFSDVNQTCLQLIRNYRAETQHNLALLGSATPIINQSSGHIVAANALIFWDAHQKQFVDRPLVSTIGHEFGHILGLGHEFARDQANKIIHPSIMGYGASSQITAWDRLAVKALYP